MAMESFRSVHISYTVSGETLGIVWQKPEHEWTTFVSALHYYAARKIGIPIWCVDLVWKYDPWDEAQLPMEVQIECVISSEFEIASSTAEHVIKRCCNCWEDCDDVEELFDENPSYWRGRRDPREFMNCDECAPQYLCRLCHVDLPDGGSSCLTCFAGPPERAETDGDYLARVASTVLLGLTDSQMKRWECVRMRAQIR